jgi:hypothetical protein
MKQVVPKIRCIADCADSYNVNGFNDRQSSEQLEWTIGRLSMGEIDCLLCGASFNLEMSSGVAKNVRGDCYVRQMINDTQNEPVNFEINNLNQLVEKIVTSK